ncbi:MAG: HAMP domain-containing histidine kinase [Chitinophagaceae bacterium]|nr:HAMP domain-containing histidine kinase [Chitinophagaceae bacterium]
MKMRWFNISKLKFVNFIYWVFLTYMIAAFVWWYVSLEKQNSEIATVKFQSIPLNDPALYKKVKSIEAFEARKTKQYIYEGVTFLFLFLLGAIYVYRSLLKQLRYSNQQQNFMMAVTHELKTPIAITQLNIETLLKRELDPAQKKMLIENTLKETHRLDALCNNILLASQLDMGKYESNMQLIDLSDIIQKLVHSFQERFEQRVLVTTITPSVFIQAEPLLIQLLVNNLLDNAHKYSTLSSQITVQLTTKENQISLTVKDEGVGIPMEERTKIFEKFYRIGDESTRTTKGTGLGLYLCKKISEFHQATINVDANAPNGSVFTINFPI